jgi:tetratricopeptide (TPR) repeat protein
MKKCNCFVVLCFLAFCQLAAQTESNTAEEMIKKLEVSLLRDSDNPTLLLQLGIAYHDLGVQGDKDSVKRAEKVLKKLLKLDPQNSEAHGWYGSVLTLKGRSARLPIMRMKHVSAGIKEMDNAVELSPDNVTVRMIRANNNLGLPDVFNRVDVVISDLKYLISMKEKDINAFDDELLAEIYLNLGRAFDMRGDLNEARENWRKVIEIRPESVMAQSAKVLLTKTRE